MLIALSSWRSTASIVGSSAQLLLDALAAACRAAEDTSCEADTSRLTSCSLSAMSIPY